MWKLVKSELLYRNAVINVAFQFVFFFIFIGLIIYLISQGSTLLESLFILITALYTLFILALANFFDLLRSLIYEHRARVHCLLPLNRLHVALGRALFPIVIHLIFFVLISVPTVLMTYFTNPDKEYYLYEAVTAISNFYFASLLIVFLFYMLVEPISRMLALIVLGLILLSIIIPYPFAHIGGWFWMMFALDDFYASLAAPITGLIVLISVNILSFRYRKSFLRN